MNGNMGVAGQVTGTEGQMGRPGIKGSSGTPGVAGEIGNRGRIGMPGDDVRCCLCYYYREVCNGINYIWRSVCTVELLYSGHIGTYLTLLIKERGVLISGCWNRGVPLYTEVSSFQGVEIE